jgi:hypothetical protein
MKKLILVPLKRNDRVEDFMPYIAEVARPGTEAVFMVPYPVDGFRWSRADCGGKAIEEGLRLADYYNWDNNLAKAKTRLGPAMAALGANGIETAVEVYAGSMRRAVRTHAANGEVHLIVSRGSVGNWIERLVDAGTSLFRMLKRPAHAPVMLLKPSILV